MSDLAPLLALRTEALLQRWTRSVDELLAPGPLSGPVLRDHVADVLRELVRALERGVVPENVLYAREHGRQRYRVGFRLDALVEEYGLLRGLIFDLAQEVHLARPLDELRLVTDFITRAIAEGVAEYDRQKAAHQEALSVRLATALGVADLGTFEWNTSTQAVHLDDRARALFAFGPTEGTSGDEVFGRIAPADRERARGETQRGITRRSRVELEYRLELPDGSTRTILSIGEPAPGADGPPLMVGFFRDVTEQRSQAEQRQRLFEAEQAARAAATVERQKQHDLFMQAPAAIAILEGPGHTFLFANPAYRALVGGRDVVGKAVLEALPEVQGQGFDLLLDRVVATGIPIVGNETPIWLARTGTGEVEQAFLNFTYSPKHDVRGQADGVLVSAVDVTPQVRARQQVEALVAQLRQSEERLRLVVDASGTGTWEMNVATHELVVDERFRAIFGLAPDEPFDLTRALALMPPDDRDRIAHLVADALAGKDGGRYRVEHQVLRSTGPCWMEARGQAIFDPDGQAERFLGTGIDITERKRVEHERERLVEELSRSNAALDQFAHVASHDLKAPLRGIGNLAEWIEEDLGDAVTDDAREKFGLLRGRVRHLESMVNGILTFASASRPRADAESVEVGPLLAEVIGLLSPPPHVTLTVAPPMPTLRTHRVALQQVFMNLLGNAIKHTQQPGAAIRVEASEEGAFAHFLAADNGPGIAPEHHERIWGLFQKLASRPGVEGTGIGLAVVKKTVESRGGRVWVESRPGQGASFHVLWPRDTTPGATSTRTT